MILTPQSAFDNKYYLRHSERKEIYFYISLKAGAAKTTAERVPLNISLVIDRSGSMESENKLTYAKKAAIFAVEHLNANDTISVVEYDDKISVAYPASKVSHKEVIKKAINQLTARGSTNLSGGMTEGYAQVLTHKQNNFVNRVLLLTDGLANEGVTDVKQLEKIAVQYKREKGIAISTFGVGADFNENLMIALAEHGSGNYYFIDTPDKIPQIFAQELKGLLSVVAQNTSLKIQFPNKNLSLKKVFGYNHSVQNDVVQIDFHDVFANEEKAVLLKFEVIKPITENITFNTTITYDDVSETINRVSTVLKNELVMTNSAINFAEGKNAEVAKNIALFESNEMFENALKDADNRDFEKARTQINVTKIFINQQMQDMPEPAPELQKQMDDILAYESNLSGMENMDEAEIQITQKRSKMASYSARKKR